MSSRAERGGSAITREAMCVIERMPDGSLRTAFHPLAYDAQVVGRLQALGTWMRGREGELGQRLLDAVSPLVADVPGVRESDVGSVVGHFQDVALDVCAATGVDVGLSKLDLAPLHDNACYPDGVHLLSPKARLIRGFDVTFEAVEACGSRLEEPERQCLVWEHRQAAGLMPYLSAALDEYEYLFQAYVGEAAQICPSLFARKSFCRDFDGSYAGAELDYLITPGNQCVVDRVCEYYWACVLEWRYEAYENTEAIEAYSHRRLGWGYACKNSNAIVLDASSDLRLTYETNFGYGRDRYFWSTLSYKGISAINASFIMFFEGAGKVKFANHTFNYEVEEASFEACFDDAVRLHSEFLQLGEARFVGKYFRKSLSDLSDLLTIVAGTDTFLKITTLERFGALTSGPTNELIPDEGFAGISMGLSAAEEGVVARVVDSALAATRAGWTDGCARERQIRAPLDQVLGGYAEGSLQLLVKKDLVRTRIRQGLAPLLPDARDADAIAKRLVAPDEGFLVERYEGYGLMSMRVEKAKAALGPIERLREIAAATGSEPAIGSILGTCSLIAYQARAYISAQIEPELDRMIAERNRVCGMRGAAEAKIADAMRLGYDAGQLQTRSAALVARVRAIDGDIAELNGRRRHLEEYIRRVASLVAAESRSGHPYVSGCHSAPSWMDAKPSSAVGRTRFSVPVACLSGSFYNA